MLIGFGFRDCIGDLVQGKVDPEEVRYIFRGVSIKVPIGGQYPVNRESLLDYTRRFSESFGWNVEYAVRLVAQFWDQGKILHSNGLCPARCQTWFDEAEEINCKFVHYHGDDKYKVGVV